LETGIRPKEDGIFGKTCCEKEGSPFAPREKPLGDEEMFFTYRVNLSTEEKKWNKPRWLGAK